ncbi:MAG: F0F1 ATP synthase subunit B [Betaproteobacteria bacterium RIFCSPLOWO2_02_FULL_62_17]|nr:MAG: F0F1 ATP synthase subunit B [Betaproteobacteria bacterium RIFCSPLOWO2_02_FULL_62_17]
MNINVTLFAQALVFIAFIWFAVKFIWPYLLHAIETRQKTIADGLAAAEKGKQALEISSKQAGEEIGKARGRAGDIIAQAEKRASQMIEEAKIAARDEGGREKAAAKAEIEQEVSRAREALREEVAGLVIAGAEKILRREVNAQTHAELLTQMKKEI